MAFCTVEWRHASEKRKIAAYLVHILISYILLIPTVALFVFNTKQKASLCTYSIIVIYMYMNVYVDVYTYTHTYVRI